MPAGQPDAGDLAQRGVRLLGRGRVDARAHAAALRAALERRRLGLLDLVLAALADQLLDRGHRVSVSVEWLSSVVLRGCTVRDWRRRCWRGRLTCAATPAVGRVGPAAHRRRQRSGRRVVGRCSGVRARHAATARRTPRHEETGYPRSASRGSKRYSGPWSRDRSSLADATPRPAAADGPLARMARHPACGPSVVLRSAATEAPKSNSSSGTAWPEPGPNGVVGRRPSLVAGHGVHRRLGLLGRLDPDVAVAGHARYRPG